MSFESAVSFLTSSDLLFVLFWVVLLLGAFAAAFTDSPGVPAHERRAHDAHVRRA